jgi:hypothetical protein
VLPDESIMSHMDVDLEAGSIASSFDASALLSERSTYLLHLMRTMRTRDGK